MRPVADEFQDSQQFGEGATGGVVANSDPNSGMGYYVYLYGDYQPFGHAGKDIACPIGTPIHAITDGVVLYAGWAEDLPGDDSWGPSGYFQRWALYKYFGGIITVIQHDGWISVTAHQSNNDAVSAGQRVTEGQVIGLSGNTKTRTTQVAPHVHIEALIDLSYSTGHGLIYGRTDPTLFFGSGALAPAGDIITPSEEDDMSAADVAAIRGDLNTVHQAVLDGDQAVRADVATVHATIIRDVGGQLGALREVLSQLAAGQGVTIDYQRVEVAAKAGAAEALANGIDVNVTVNGKG